MGWTAAKEIARLRRQVTLLRRKLKAHGHSTPAVSPLAPAHFPDIAPVAGVKLATLATGVRYKGRDDVLLASLAPGSTVAGVFTKSATRAAPVLDCEAKRGGTPEGGAAFFVNAGNANAFTGNNGRASVEAIANAVSGVLDIPVARAFTASTGVIGEPLPAEKITTRINDIAARLGEADWLAAATAIGTTDTFPKGADRTLTLGGTEVRIAGIAKGSGMIAPDMATMLAYVFTDAAVQQDVLQDILTTANASTFNCATVDGDTSTSDTLLVGATGASGADEITDSESPEGMTFASALTDVLRDLAQQVVRDGEGATKFIDIAVQGAVSDADARKVASAIANSPLVKTAIAGEDPNWGRIVMAIGKSGAEADRDRITIRFGAVTVAERGWVSPTYTEAQGAAHMAGDEIQITVDLGLGDGAATVWTCDLTHGYISINADYRS